MTRLVKAVLPTHLLGGREVSIKIGCSEITDVMSFTRTTGLQVPALLIQEACIITGSEPPTQGFSNLTVRTSSPGGFVKL